MRRLRPANMKSGREAPADKRHRAKEKNGPSKAMPKHGARNGTDKRKELEMEWGRDVQDGENAHDRWGKRGQNWPPKTPGKAKERKHER